MIRKIRMPLAALAVALGCSTAASAAETVTYTYDARGRMIKVVVNKSSGTNNDVQACYKLDKAGNRTNVQVENDVDASSLPACP